MTEYGHLGPGKPDPCMDKAPLVGWLGGEKPEPDPGLVGCSLLPEQHSDPAACVAHDKAPLGFEPHSAAKGPPIPLGTHVRPDPDCGKPEPSPEQRRFFIAKVNHGFIVADSEEVGVRRVRWAFSEFQELVEFLEAEWGLVPPKPETEVGV